MSEISGVDLTASELSYLLATLTAPTIVGIDATALFPGKQSSRETLFRKGREKLEAHGWMKPIPDHPDEYELDPELFELVSIIAAPSFVIATQRISAERERQDVLHYLADESIVELSSSEEGTYRTGFVADSGALYKRIAAMLDVAVKAPSKHLELDGEVFEHIQSLALKGMQEQARASLESAGVTSAIQPKARSCLSELNPAKSKPDVEFTFTVKGSKRGLSGNPRRIVQMLK
jgi:hypothetical protein